LEDALAADVIQAAQLHVDETSWPEYGLLISDGYGVYRARENRLRCWPHLVRKLTNEWRIAAPGRWRRVPDCGVREDSDTASDASQSSPQWRMAGKKPRAG